MKERLDVLLVNQGFFQSREKAKRAIMAGEVFVDGRVFDKPGMSISEDSVISVKNDSCPYVSRGGFKLEKAIRDFNIDLNGLVCMDIGASTGGFTDCMLQSGAHKVYAIDVGYGQLDYKLRIDERVVNIEKCNFRYFDNIGEGGEPIILEPVDFASIDVSFISLKHIFPICQKLLRPLNYNDDSIIHAPDNNIPSINESGKVCCLVKPQFEAGKEQVGKKGIIKDIKVHREVIENVIGYALSSGLYPTNLSFSPITGAKGNIEYLLYLNKSEDMGYNIQVEDILKDTELCIGEMIEKTIEEAHSSLK